METRDIRLVFNYITRISKSYNLRPQITKSKGISINSIPSLLDQLKSLEENTSDAEHLDYMKNGLSIYSLPLISVPDILEGKHKTASTETVADEVINHDENHKEDNSEENVEGEQTVEDEKVSKKKEKKSKKEKKEEKKNKNKESVVQEEKKEKNEEKSDKKKDKKEKKDKPKGIAKLEKMKEKLHKKK